MYIVHRFIFLVIILELHIANIKIDIGAIHVDEQVNSEIDVPILVAGLSPGEWDFKCRKELGPLSESVVINIQDDCTQYKCSMLPNGDIIIKIIVCPPVPQEIKEICSRSMTVASALPFPECCPIQSCYREVLWNLVTGLTTHGSVGGLAGGEPKVGIGALTVKVKTGNKLEANHSSKHCEH